ncbi:flavin reductase family protein [Peribacillus cavernae]|uniref:Flavin reductase family protein n=1 Tax=Peribacillus cavernae TaxID=1674310 RepID=A0A433HJ10_9BACI|nr:flavin reductase family protein [Peribacillus cavernae]MDQ0217785.1 flavin reductase (DIM6/NTAB) family NADH-FMN oxidoreductase RutF [Peribacillus cavernae]RUQ28239.1 flavin reductase family protein [Peribacillus cavernae]
MLSFDSEKMTERENYKILTGSIIPRPVALVTTVSESGTVNVAPFSYFNIISANPPMVSLSIQRRNGIQKDTARNAVEKGEFVVHITDENIVEEANKTAAELPYDESELPLSTLTPAESSSIAVPGIKEAKVRFECIVEDTLQLGGTDTKPACDLLIGRVVTYHIEPTIYNDGKIDANGLKPISRLAGNNYAKLGETFSLKRPR